MPASSFQLYTCLLESQADDEAFVQIYWARGRHPGEAIEKMKIAARLNGMADPEARHLDPAEEKPDSQDPIETNSAGDVFWSTGRFYFDPEPTFRLPHGIIASFAEVEHDIAAITPGYTRQKNEAGKTTIEVNVEGHALLALYEQLLGMRDSYRVFWYLLHDHWDAAQDEFLVNESLDRPDAILAHLRAHPYDSLLNGGVTLTAYHLEGATNLNLSDHKRIVIFTYSDTVADEYAAALNAAGYPEMPELVSIDHHLPHWHHPHAAGRTRADLMEHLRSIGFQDWQPDQASQ